MSSLVSILEQVLLFAPPLLLAVILHEVSHGYVAEKLGDPTARNMGRITLNPLVHIDRTMTIFLPAVLILLRSPIVFGGAKPVPVNPLNFPNPRRGMAWVALAGPLASFTLAGISGALFFLFKIVFHIIPIPLLGELIVAWLGVSFIINIVLGVFNLLPIPPLDGGRIAVGFLPMRLARPLANLEPYGIPIVVGILFALHFFVSR